MPISPANRHRRSPAKAGPSPNGFGRKRFGRDGFTLIEVVLALAILGMLAALGLPFIRPGSGATALRSKTFEIVALLRTDRNAALRSGTPGTVSVDAQAGTIRSQTSQAFVLLPASVSLRPDPTIAQGIRFYPDGTASGGRLFVTSGGKTLVVDVNGVTSAVSVLGGAP